MTERASAKKCGELLAHLAKQAKVPTSAPFAPGKGYKHGFFNIEVSYGQPRLTFVYPGTGESDISPRLPAGQMMMWLREYGVAGLKSSWKELGKRK